MADSTCHATALPLRDSALHKRARLFCRTRDARPPAPATTNDCSDLALCKPTESRVSVPVGSLRYNRFDGNAKSVLRAACKREDGANVELQI